MARGSGLGRFKVMAQADFVVSPVALEWSVSTLASKAFHLPVPLAGSSVQMLER